MLPNFLLIGAMKSGTTSLYSSLNSHPEIFMPANKEPGFFSDEGAWIKGLKWYESLFARHEAQKAVGEASTNYTKYPYYPDVPKRIAGIQPKMRFIYIIRHPIERIYSHYLHNFYAGRETLPVVDALSTNRSYVQVSLYYRQIQQYLEYFPRNNILILLLEDLKENYLLTLKTVFKFLDVDPSNQPRDFDRPRNQTKFKKGRGNLLLRFTKRLPIYDYLAYRISDETKAKFSFLFRNRVSIPGKLPAHVYNTLQEEIMPDVENLRNFLKRDLKCWDFCPPK